ncbi:hypothetical protein RRG08_033563 [Elysia crispata]|uniref:Uncharacterized protein n=1 Tax=Elysia crispata TaxID=231223 RepID=A0AAE0XNR6_9GAST|nr:hypothetical protein RRG08_033563 [Elysia crispata]
MNQLRAWLYGHDSNSVSRFKNDNSKGSDVISRHLADENNTKESSGGSGGSENNFKRAILKIIPLAPGDCLECKLVGSGVMMMSGMIVITSAMKASSRKAEKVPLKGPRKTLYYAICVGLFVAFETAAICRLFDLGLFTKHMGQAKLR